MTLFFCVNLMSALYMRNITEVKIMSIQEKLDTITAIKERQRKLLNLAPNAPFSSYKNAMKKLIGYNYVGKMGEVGFGVSPTENLPAGMSEMTGTTVLGHENYGNYQYSDGSIMVWIPAFYYRIGDTRNESYAKNLLNSIDIKNISDFVSYDAAKLENFVLHRAFVDGGVVKDGFFIDKFQCSNNNGIPSSIQFKSTLKAATGADAFTSLNGAPPNNPVGAVTASKIRGPNFTIPSIFMYRAISMLSLGCNQTDPLEIDVAWIDPLKSYPSPRGNNSTNKDAHDTGVIFTGLTGSGAPFAKTTHNGQLCGVTDLNGNGYEISIGLTKLNDGGYYTAHRYLNENVKLSTLNPWGLSNIDTNYTPLTITYGPLDYSFAWGGASKSYYYGNGNNQEFSNAFEGVGWVMTGAGIPQNGGFGTGSSNVRMGQDRIQTYTGTVENMVTLTGGGIDNGVVAGIWMTDMTTDMNSGGSNRTFRLGLYKN